MTNLITLDAVTSSALGFWTDEVVVGPRCVSPLAKVKGTGLPAAGPAVPTFQGTRPSVATGIYTLAAGLMWTDTVQGIAVRVPAAAAVQGDPPRRTPPRC